MTSRRNAFKQCDVERALRAAKAVGAGDVIVRPDGSIHIETVPAEGERAGRRKSRLAAEREVVF